uniref:Xaa-Pro aminopeptidase n=1 Tax=Anisakis simplex TaxID=6269 RepID=A0A0M3K730_ANISI
LSGFTGSNAYVVVTNKEALLWTDGRYTIQAKKQLGDGWKIMEEATPKSITPLDWIVHNMPTNSVVAFDAQLHTYGDATRIIDVLKSANMKCSILNENLVDKLWVDRPRRSSNKVIALEKSEHGQESSDKIDEIRKKMMKKKCSSAIFTALDDIAWLLNIRGADIPYNPLVYSNVLITEKEAHLFIDENKLDDNIRKRLPVITHDYDHTVDWLKNWNEEQIRNNRETHKVLLADTVNYQIGSVFGKDFAVVGASLIQSMKARKNDIELERSRLAHMRDSVALVEFFCWLENELRSGNQVTELKACEKVKEFREKKPYYVDLSFETIAAVDEHAASPHYAPDQITGQRAITEHSVFLLDSGAHYRDGTTDVTRTVSYANELEDELKFLNTLVLKGHIDTAMMQFPDGINGIRIDVISRQHLWENGLDFGHGVGHGVGHFLNVHEGPIGIGYRRYSPEGAIHEGMIITIEPGYYSEGKWGIRIENCYEVVKAPKTRLGSDNFLTFEPLTYVPIQKSLIDKQLLSKNEVDWLNRYHEKCLEKVGEYLLKEKKKDVYDWLTKACSRL